MLGNNADTFFTTPMRTTVHRGGNMAHSWNNTMPNPRKGGSSTKVVTMDGMGDDAGTTSDPADVVAQLANAAQQFIPSQAQNIQAVANRVAPAPAPAKSNTLLYVGLGLAAVGAFFMLRKKSA